MTHRELLVTKYTRFTPVAGRCSVCLRQFEVELTEDELPASAQQELRALFDDHLCYGDGQTGNFFNGNGPPSRLETF